MRIILNGRSASPNWSELFTGAYFHHLLVLRFILRSNRLLIRNLFLYSLLDTLAYLAVLFRTDNHPDLSSFEVKLDGINRKWVVAPDLEIIHTPVTCFA